MCRTALGLSLYIRDRPTIKSAFKTCLMSLVTWPEFELWGFADKWIKIPKRTRDHERYILFFGTILLSSVK